MKYTESQGREIMDRLAKATGKAVKPAPRRATIAVPTRSPLEADMESQIAAAGLPKPETEAFYLVGSRHRLDFCWRGRKLGLECQGEPHRIKGRFKADIGKRAEGLLQGWRILEVGRDEIKSGQAIEWLKKLLEAP